jgi:hypothetical protein
MYFPRMALNCDLSDLSLPSSQDYRHESLAPGLKKKNLVKGRHSGTFLECQLLQKLRPEQFQVQSQPGQFSKTCLKKTFFC